MGPEPPVMLWEHHDDVRESGLYFAVLRSAQDVADAEKLHDGNFQAELRDLNGGPELWLARPVTHPTMTVGIGVAVTVYRDDESRSMVVDIGTEDLDLSACEGGLEVRVNGTVISTPITAGSSG